MFKGVYAELRAAMTISEFLNKDLGRIKAKTQKNIDKYFFELFKCFKEWDGKAALSLLKEQLERKVGKFKLLDQRSVGITEGIEIKRLELSNLIAQYELIKKQRKAKSCYMHAI